MRNKKPIFNIFIILLAVYLATYGEIQALKSPLIDKPIQAKQFSSKVFNAQIITAILFGGFRGIIVDFIWIHIDTLWHHARFYKLPELYELVTIIQPEYINGWIMGGWHMAYNMSLELPNVRSLSPQLRKKIEMNWIFRGIDFLKAGSQLNPDDAKLYFEIGWTYYHRLKDYKSSIKWFEQSAKQEDALYITSRLIAHAIEKSGNKVKSYQKWLSLKNHPSYMNLPAKKIIDKNIARLHDIIKM